MFKLRNRRPIRIGILLYVGFAWIMSTRSHAAEPIDMELAGRMEISAAASFQDYDDVNIYNIPLRLGYFASSRLEFELESIFSGSGFGQGGYTVSGLLSYHLPGPSDGLFFVLAGLGFTNSRPVANAYLREILDTEPLLALNAGAGLKAFFGNHAALRAEFRVQKFNGNESLGVRDISARSLFVGVSIFP